MRGVENMFKVVFVTSMKFSGNKLRSDSEQNFYILDIEYQIKHAHELLESHIDVQVLVLEGGEPARDDGNVVHLITGLES